MENPGLARYFRSLDQRRKQLGMTYAVLAKKSGVSQPTVVRILSGEHPTANFQNVAAIADTLGMKVEFRASVRVDKLREEQAKKKARRLVGFLQGTSALEGQGLDRATREEMIRQTVHELMAGSRRALWGD